MANIKFSNFVLVKLIFFLKIVTFIMASTDNSSTYTVGVVETNALFYGNREAILSENIQGYKTLVKKYIKVNDEVDIIIFPEATLNSEKTPVFVPDINNTIIPSDEINNVVSELSCLASDYKKYMVFNLIEKENCTVESQKEKNDKTPCSSTGLNLYNTNVVFDRNGTLISKYRKWTLYDSISINRTQVPEYATFKTDFGVEFASVTGLDILWWTPTMELVGKGYRHFVHPIWWYSELPFLTANQVHQGWAYAANVNLLTAAGNYPAEGATGTGVYSGQWGPLVTKTTSRRTKEILIAKVPKSNLDKPENSVADNKIKSKFLAEPQRIYHIKLKRDITVNNYTNILLKPKTRSVYEIVCHGDFCCTFKIIRMPFGRTKKQIHYSYRLVAYSGERKFARNPKKLWMKACAVIACRNDKSIESCAKVFDDNVHYVNTQYFESIVITGKFSKQKKMLIMPNSVDALLRPIPVNGFKFKKVDRGNTTEASIELKRPVSDLLTFGLFADYYDGFENQN